MKKNIQKVLLIAIAFLATTSVFGQDIIVKRDGSELQTAVIEVGTVEIKYKNFDNQTGPTYVINKSEVFMIKYQDGKKDVFQKESASSTTSTNQTVANPLMPCLSKKSSKLEIMNTLQKNDLSSYQKWRSGNITSKVGTGLLVPGLTIMGLTVAGGVAGAITGEIEEDVLLPIITGGLVVGGTLVCVAIPLKIVGSARRKAALREYNAKCNPSASVNLNLNIYGNGVGLALGF